MSARLTILLALKDRAPFTLRWMRFANEERFPFKVILADGGTDASATAIFAVKSNFPNLNYEYIRYPVDENYTVFYKKISDALELIDTPYLLMADNDDFFCIDGLIKSIEFLDQNPDYVGARGSYQGFSVHGPCDKGDVDESELYGKLRPKGLVYASISYAQESASDRLRAYFSAWTPNWYNVHRTGNFRTCWNQIVALDIKDIFLMEHALSGLLVTSGKMLGGCYPYYYRQFGETYVTASKEAIARDGDIFQRMLSENWAKQYWLLVTVLAGSLQNRDGLDEKTAKEVVQLAYRKYITPSIIRELSSNPESSRWNRRIRRIMNFVPGMDLLRVMLRNKKIINVDRYLSRIGRFLRG